MKRGWERHSQLPKGNKKDALFKLLWDLTFCRWGRFGKVRSFRVGGGWGGEKDFGI